MRSTTTSSAKKILMRISIAFVLLFALFANTDTAKSQSYCNPYFYYPYYAYIYYLNFYNSDRSIDYWNYVYSYSYYPMNYTTSSFANEQWSGGDRFYFYIYVQGSFRYYFHTRIWVDWNDDGDWTDAGEEVFKPTSLYGYSRYSIRSSFVIPATAPAGKHRMRVMVGYYYYMWYYANACGTGSTTYRYYRSAHDYTLWIAPKNDAGITGFYQPTDNFNSDDPQEVEVEIKNFSDLELYEADIYWSVNGTQYGPYHWTGNLEKDQTERVVIATNQIFTPQAPWDPFNFEAWTDPNSLVGEDAGANAMPDGDQSNDRAQADIQCILNDAGFVGADAMLPIYYGVNDVILTIKNYAPRPLERVTINYSIDGVAQPSYTAVFNPPVPRGETRDVVVGTYFFGSGIRPYLIEAETSNPNGVADQVPANDAGTAEVYKALEGGTYTIGPRDSDYEDLESLMEFIGYWGLAGPVTFLIRQGTYYASFVLAPKSGRQFPMTFESISRRALDVTIYNDGSENDYIFQFDGYNDLIFKNLTFESDGRFFEFLNGNNNILFDHCVFNGGDGGGGYPTMQSPYGDNDIMQINGNVSGLEISNCQFNGGESSIYASQGYYVLLNWYIHDNEFNDANFGFIVLEDNLADYIVIENNVFNGNRTKWGIGMWMASNSMIIRNRINGISNGISNGGGILCGMYNGNGGDDDGTFLSTGGNEISDNTITVSDAFGIFIPGGEGTLVENNIISGTAMDYTDADGYAAIMDVFSQGSVITGNTIGVTNMDGIRVIESGNSSISYNKVSSSTDGTGKEIPAGINLMDVDFSTIADNAIATNNANGISATRMNEVHFYYNSVYTMGMYSPMFLDQVSASGPPMVYNDKFNKGDKQLAVTPGDVTYRRNIFQHGENGQAGIIIDDVQTMISDENNWWTGGNILMNYNGALLNFASYQANSGQDANSSNVEAMFMGPTDLRLTTVDPNLYFTNAMLGGNDFTQYEEYDLDGEGRARAFYKGAYTLNPVIEIVQQPEDIIDCYGTTDHAFIVVANVNYNAELSYQWYKDNEAIFGEVGPILYINDPLNYEMGAIYKCKITSTGEAEPVWTRPALLYTLRPTEITRQPDNVRVDLGDVATFEIDMHVYREAPSMYQPDIQWYRGGVALQENDRIAGVNSSIMTIRDVQPDDLSDDYYVVISGMCGTDQSDNITLSEIPSLIVDDLPATTETCIGSDVSFTVTASSTVPGVTITYQWYKDGVELQDDNKYMGTATATLMLFSAEAGDAGNYSCEVMLEGFDQATVSTMLEIEDEPMITTDLEPAVSVETDKTLELTVVAEGKNLEYQWYKDDQELAGETNATYTKDNVTSDDEGTYKVRVRNMCGEVYSAECVVTVTPFVILGVEDEDGLALNQNVPNPFATQTRISFVLPEAAQIRLAITDANGKELAVIADGTASAGLNEYTVDANALNLSSGVYYYTLRVNGKSFTKTMVVVK